MGDYVGRDNSFDSGMPREEYCTWDEIKALEKGGAWVGWHTWSHRDLTTLSYDEIVKEVTPPYPMSVFAYPYGKFNKDVVRAVKEAGYKQAFSVFDTDGTEFTIKRDYIW